MSRKVFFRLATLPLDFDSSEMVRAREEKRGELANILIAKLLQIVLAKLVQVYYVLHTHTQNLIYIYIYIYITTHD